MPQNGKAFPILVRSRIGKAFSGLSVNVDSVWRYEYLRAIGPVCAKMSRCGFLLLVLYILRLLTYKTHTR